MCPEAPFSDAVFDQQALLARRKMIQEQIRARGVKSERVLDAMMAIPREQFIPTQQAAGAHEDRALPIECGQTISQPYIVAYMTELLNVTPHCKVLEVGTGSGYQAAILSQLAREVHTIERFERLREQAERVIMALGISNVFFHTGDGTMGLSPESPFDRIIVTAGAPRVPQPLVEQLADQGRLVLPVGPEADQTIFCITRDGQRIIETPQLAVRFVRLVGEEGWKSESSD